jgi:hypothetical protein
MTRARVSYTEITLGEAFAVPETMAAPFGTYFG